MNRFASLVLLCLVVLSIDGCSWLSSSSAPPAIQAGVDTSICILTVASSDQESGMSGAEIVDDVIAKCGATAVQIASVLDAASKAFNRVISSHTSSRKSGRGANL